MFTISIVCQIHTYVCENIHKSYIEKSPFAQLLLSLILNVLVISCRRCGTRKTIMTNTDSENTSSYEILFSRQSPNILYRGYYTYKVRKIPEGKPPKNNVYTRFQNTLVSRRLPWISVMGLSKITTITQHLYTDFLQRLPQYDGRFTISVINTIHSSKLCVVSRIRFVLFVLSRCYESDCDQTRKSVKIPTVVFRLSCVLEPTPLRHNYVCFIQFASVGGGVMDSRRQAFAVIPVATSAQSTQRFSLNRHLFMLTNKTNGSVLFGRPRNISLRNKRNNFNYNDDLGTVLCVYNLIRNNVFSAVKNRCETFG